MVPCDPIQVFKLSILADHGQAFIQVPKPHLFCKTFLLLPRHPRPSIKMYITCLVTTADRPVPSLPVSLNSRDSRDLRFEAHTDQNGMVTMWHAIGRERGLVGRVPSVNDTRWVMTFTTHRYLGVVFPEVRVEFSIKKKSNYHIILLLSDDDTYGVVWAPNPTKLDGSYSDTESSEEADGFLPIQMPLADSNNTPPQLDLHDTLLELTPSYEAGLFDRMADLQPIAWAAEDFRRAATIDCGSLLRPDKGGLTMELEQAVDPYGAASKLPQPPPVRTEEQALSGPVKRPKRTRTLKPSAEPRRSGRLAAKRL